MIEHVIVPVDGSKYADRALPPAVDLAARFGATLLLLQATHPDDADVAQEDLGRRARGVDAPEVELVVDTLNGPVAALAELVESRPGSLVCMTTHGRGGLGRALFGSVAEEALREVSVPFALVGPKSDPQAVVPGTIVVPLDGSRRSESVLPTVGEWATTLQAGVWIVSVVDPADAERVRASGEDLAEESYVERVARSMPTDLPSADWEVLHSADPAHAVVEFAAGHGCPMIALATHGRSGVARVVVGSVAARVVHEHPGITLVVRTADVADPR